MKMTSRERVLRAFHKIEGSPDRPPIQFDLCRRLIEEFGKRLSIPPDYSLSYYEDLTCRISANDIRTALGSDVVVVGATVAAGFTPVPIRDSDASGSQDVFLNEFEMHTRPSDICVDIVKYPLADAAGVDDVIDYHFPSAFALGRFDKAKRDISRYRDSHYIIGNCELSIFDLARRLTGLEKYMAAFTAEEQWIEVLNDRAEVWTLGLAKQLVELGVDAIWFGENLCTGNSILMDLDAWRERLKPRYSRIIRILRDMRPDIHIIMHSSGAVAPLVEDFIETGIDILNPIRPGISGHDPDELIARYRGRIMFFGGIDQEELLPSGDIDALSAEIRRRADSMGHGGYLMAPDHIIRVDTDPHTVEAMIRIIRELGNTQA